MSAQFQQSPGLRLNLAIDLAVAATALIGIGIVYQKVEELRTDVARVEASIAAQQLPGSAERRISSLERGETETVRRLNSIDTKLDYLIEKTRK